MNRQVFRSVFAFLVIFFATAAHASVYYLDSNQDSTRTHYRTSQEACITGELESRIQAYRASETNPNVHYRISALLVGTDDGLGEFECRGDIERTYSSIWVTLELVDTFVYGTFGSTEPCNISGYGDPATGACGSPKCTVGGSNCCDVCNNGTNPIHTASGNKYEKETDYVGQGAFPLRFERVYAGNDTYDNLPIPMGVGWSHTYSSHLVAYPSVSGGSIDHVTAFRADGRVLDFSASGSSWLADPDVRERLAATASGWQITTPNDDVENYDTDGRLTAITSRSGLVQTLSYVDTSGHPSNQVQRVTDPQGRHLDFTYDASGRLTQLTEPDGQVVTYSYDTANNLASAIYPAPGGGTVTRTYAYNETGQTSGASLPHALTGLSDESGTRYASWGYTASGRANLSVHGAFSGGTVDRTSLQFNSNGTTTVTDALGQARTFGFTTSFGVARRTSLDHVCNYCGNAAQANTWDANGFPASETDFNGQITQFTYDARGLEDQRVEASGTAQQRTIATTWSSTFHVPLTRTVADAQGTTVSSGAWVDNSRGQPLAYCEVDPTNSAATGYACSAGGTVPAGVRRWTYTYCDAVNGTQCPIVGLVLTATGPRTDLTQTTSYSYYMDSATAGCTTPGGACHQPGDLYQVTDPLGHVMTYVSYDADGRVTRITDANGVNTDFTYSPRGWLTSRSVAGATTTFGYTAYGAVNSVTDPDGVVTTFTYDAAHRLTDITDAQGNYVHYTLDAAGNKTQEQIFDSTGTAHYSESKAFNALGQLTTIVDGLNHTVFNASVAGDYDANGNLKHSSDALGVQTQRSYDALNRLVGTIRDYNGTDASTKNSTTTVAYDALDRVTGVSDPNSLVTSYTYDGLGNLTHLQSPDTGLSGGSAGDVFDAAGNLTQHTDARGVVTQYTYDALNRLTGKIYPAHPALNVTYTYDQAAPIAGCPSNDNVGHLTTVADASGSTAWCYTAQGDISQVRQTINSVSYLQSFTYTPGRRLQTQQYPSGFALSYSYDSDGRVATVGYLQNAGPYGSYTNSTVTPLITAVSYLPFGPMSGYSWAQGGQNVVRTYDPNYALTDITGSALNLHFLRDAKSRISAEGDTAGASPANESYQSDALDRLTQLTDANGATEQAFSYNLTGDRLSKALAGQSPLNYGYQSGTHQLTLVGSASRSVDADGNTTAMLTPNGTQVQLVYDDRNLLTQVQSGGSAIANYQYNGQGIRVWRTITVPSAGQAATVYDPLGTGDLYGEYFAADYREYVYLNGIPVASAMDAGRQAPAISYLYADGLGTVRAATTTAGNVTDQWPWQNNAFGDQAMTGASGYYLRFPGQYYDVETGLHYNGHRYYDPSTGRYVQSDPIGLGGGLSTYAYVGGGPLQQRDSLGLQQNWSIPGQTVDMNTAALLGQYEYAKQGNPFAPEAGTLPDPNIDRNFRQAVDLYANFALGVMGGELLEAGLACKGTTTLYRAVSEAEYSDILKTGIFRSGPNSYETGKFFAEYAADAEAWGNAMEGAGNFRIIQADFPTSNANQFMRFERLDGIGPARFATFEQLGRPIISPFNFH